ncbi:MAG: iron chelate uptake ABC transporter family permease subunit, partial [Candidatus Cloacimonetes bacterium]|nr:iron chelate uptake ABC transporter family permease subunit [Candidatus Cloacimonadota bacterium]
RYLLPLSGILGAGFLVFCDTIARSILVIELPVGVITALFGAPFFVYLLRRNS